VMWSHGHGGHCHGAHMLHPQWPTGLPHHFVTDICSLVDSVPHSLTDWVPERCIDRLIEIMTEVPSDCFNFRLPVSSLTGNLGVSLILLHRQLVRCINWVADRLDWFQGWLAGWWLLQCFRVFTPNSNRTA
jgi:hypothetical protein